MLLCPLNTRLEIHDIVVSPRTTFIVHSTFLSYVHLIFVNYVCKYRMYVAVPRCVLTASNCLDFIAWIKSPNKYWLMSGAKSSISLNAKKSLVYVCLFVCVFVRGLLSLVCMFFVRRYTKINYWSRCPSEGWFVPSQLATYHQDVYQIKPVFDHF
jgi:hypothetical protein